MRFVSRILGNKIEIPKQLRDENLEGLDLLITVRPIVVDLDKDVIMPMQVGDKQDYSMSFGLKKVKSHEVDNEIIRGMQGAEEKEKEVYDENAALEEAVLRGELKPIVGEDGSIRYEETNKE